MNKKSKQFMDEEKQYMSLIAEELNVHNVDYNFYDKDNHYCGTLHFDRKKDTINLIDKSS